MKKIIVLIMTLLLCFSVSGSSQDKGHRKAQSGKVEQHSSRSSGVGREPRKTKSKKIVHVKPPKKHSKKRTGNRVMTI